MNPSDTLATPMVESEVDSEVLARALRIGLRTALGVLGDREAAAEIAQEVAIVVLRRHASLRDRHALDAWLYRTAVRAALRQAERSRTRRAAERAAAVPERAHDADAIAAAQLLAGLPPRQRAALTLRYVHDLDDHAIAAALGCRRGTVRSLLSRGLSTLREQVNPDDRMIS